MDRREAHGRLGYSDGKQDQEKDAQKHRVGFIPSRESAQRTHFGAPLQRSKGPTGPVGVRGDPPRFSLPSVHPRILKAPIRVE